MDFNRSECETQVRGRGGATGAGEGQGERDTKEETPAYYVYELLYAGGRQVVKYGNTRICVCMRLAEAQGTNIFITFAINRVLLL